MTGHDARDPDLDAVFHALADPHRRRILGAREDRAHSVGELAEGLPITLAATSKHVPSRPSTPPRRPAPRTKETPMTETADPLAHVVAPGAVRLERLLGAPIDRVWAYLTDSDLRGTWLAPGPLEGRVGGAVTLRFRHGDLSNAVEDVPERYRSMADAGHEMAGVVTAWDPPHRLRYTWDDAHEGSEVTFELTAEGDSTRLVVTQRRLAGREAMVSVGAGWHTHLAILADRLDGRAPPPFWGAHAAAEEDIARAFARESASLAPEGAAHLGAAPDGRARLRFVRDLAAPRERVWRALTESAELDRWYPARLRMEGRVGGWVRESFDGAPPLPDGTLLALDEPSHLAFELEADPAGDAATARRHRQRIDAWLHARGDGCRLVFEHTIADRASAPSIAAGWHACLTSLRQVVEGEPRRAAADADAADYAAWWGT
jgi:uncharacterized protein YndB with AHSA1/START domain